MSKFFFANALESIPRTLAESAGMDSIDIIVNLRALHKDKAGLWKGVNVLEAKVGDMIGKNKMQKKLF